MAQTLIEVAADFSRQLSAQVSIGDTTVTLNSYLDSDGVALQNNKLYGFTIDKGAKKEYIIGMHLNGTLSAIKNISRQGVATTGFAKAHRIGAPAEITDWAVLSRVLNILNGTTDLDSGTPLQYDGAPTLSDPNALATVQYVLDTVSGGTVVFNPLTVTGVAGEAHADGDWIYLKLSDGKWYKTDADDATKCVGVKIGKSRGGALAPNDGISVYIAGLETVGTYVAGNSYYISNTAGAVGTSAGTNSVKVGEADANGRLMMTNNNPNELSGDIQAALAGGGALGTPSASNQFLTQTGFTAKRIVRTYNLADSPATWTKPVGLNYIEVEAWAGGGSGGKGQSATNNCGGGGGGGAYRKITLGAASLGSTVTITIGAGGASVTTNNTGGNVGGNTTFGSFITVYGGGGGGNGNRGCGAGGGGAFSVGGDATNVPANGGSPRGTVAGFLGMAGAASVGGDNDAGGGGGGDNDGAGTNGYAGGSSITGGGGGGGCGEEPSGVGGAGGNSIYGGAGGGAATNGAGTGGAGGTSVLGGNGGAGAVTSANAVAGSVPAGGGGGSFSGNSGAGAAGRVVVTEYYS